MKKRVFLSLLLLCLTSSGWANNLDSLAMSALFDQAIKSRDSSSYFLTQAAKYKTSLSLQTQYQYSLARYYFMTGKLDSAAIVNEKGMQLAKTHSSNFWLMKINILEASIKSLRKDYQGAIQQFIEAQKIALNLGDTLTTASILNNIGNTYFGIKDYESAEHYMGEALGLLKSLGDTIYTPTFLAVRSLALLNLDRYEEAQQIAEQGLASAQKYKNFQANLIVNHCLGELERTKKNYEKATSYFNTSLAMAQQANLAHYILVNTNGLHATLTDQGKCDEAITKGQEALNLAQAQGNVDISTIIKRNLSTCYAAQGNHRVAYQLFKESFELYDSTSNLENKRAIAGLLSQIALEQKDKEIISSNLQLLEQENKIQKRNKYILALCGLAALLGLGFYYNRKLSQGEIAQIQLEKNQELLLSEMQGEEKERTRISHELHDGIASGLIGIKSQVSQSVEGQLIVEMLSKLHQEVRQISHNLMPPNLQNQSLKHAIAAYCSNFNTNNMALHINGDLSGIIDHIDKKIIYRVMQEAIQNAIKYAHATDIYVNLHTNNTSHEILIEDNGIGFDLATVNKSQGLQSMQQRIQNIGGSLHIDTSPNQGTIVNISIPTA